MKLQIKSRDRRALILLVLAVVLYGTANTLILPAYDRIAASRDLAADKEAQLKKYRRAELRKGQYGPLLKTASARVAQSESVVISAPNLSSASAEFQSLVEGIADKVGVMVIQRSIGTTKRVNNFYAELPMNLTFDSTPGQLVAFLGELRTAPHFVNVRLLQVSPTEQVLEAPKGQGLTKTIRVNMTLSTLASADIVKTETATK